jgi:hypothetical protein
MGMNETGTRRILSMAMLLAAAACASGPRGAPQAAAGAGSSYESPVVLYGVAGRNGPHPIVRVPHQTAYELGVVEPSFATPSMIDRLEAECGESNQPARCRRELRPCREKTCRIVPVY